MKPVEEVVACVYDYGTFLSLAEGLAETMEKVYYCSPINQEYQDIRQCIIGAGLDRVERLDEPLDKLDEIDLFIFPDIGWAGLQRHLRRLGKTVWGHFGANDIEVYRTLFLDILKEVGLPTVRNERIVGISALNDYLRTCENKWVKINRFRNNTETWHHRTYAQSVNTLDSLAVIFGGAKDEIVFIVQDDIKSDLEIGYDGWCIDGGYPSASFQGYEKKNELYLGSVLEYENLPEEIRLVNEALAPVLARYGYRDWWSTEIRVEDGVPYFIDATPRMAGQTGEHQLKTIRNFADIVWRGAHGILVPPDFEWRFVSEATLHYKSDTKDPTISDEWKRLEISEEALEWVKLYHYCKIDGAYHFPNRNTDEVGVVIGVGASTEAAIADLDEHLKLLEGLPVRAEVEGFADLLESIGEAEQQGIPFGGRLPKPEAVYRLTK